MQSYAKVLQNAVAHKVKSGSRSVLLKTNLNFKQERSPASLKKRMYHSKSRSSYPSNNSSYLSSKNQYESQSTETKLVLDLLGQEVNVSTITNKYKSVVLKSIRNRRAFHTRPALRAADENAQSPTKGSNSASSQPSGSDEAKNSPSSPNPSSDGDLKQFGKKDKDEIKSKVDSFYTETRKTQQQLFTEPPSSETQAALKSKISSNTGARGGRPEPAQPESKRSPFMLLLFTLLVGFSAAIGAAMVGERLQEEEELRRKHGLANPESGALLVGKSALIEWSKFMRKVDVLVYGIFGSKEMGDHIKKTAERSIMKEVQEKQAAAVISHHAADLQNRERANAVLNAYVDTEQMKSAAVEYARPLMTAAEEEPEIVEPATVEKIVEPVESSSIIPINVIVEVTAPQHHHSETETLHNLAEVESLQETPSPEAQVPQSPEAPQSTPVEVAEAVTDIAVEAPTVPDSPASNSEVNLLRQELEAKVIELTQITEDLKKAQTIKEEELALRMIHHANTLFDQKKEKLEESFVREVGQALQALETLYLNRHKAYEKETDETLHRELKKMAQHIKQLTSQLANESDLRTGVVNEMSQIVSRANLYLKDFDHVNDQQQKLNDTMRQVIVLQSVVHSNPGVPFYDQLKDVIESAKQVDGLSNLASALESDKILISTAFNGFQTRNQLKAAFGEAASDARRATLTPPEANVISVGWAAVKEAFITTTNMGAPAFEGDEKVVGLKAADQTSSAATSGFDEDQVRAKNWAIIQRAQEYLEADRLSSCFQELEKLEGGAKHFVEPWLANARQTLLVEATIAAVSQLTANISHSHKLPPL